jgi:hypothetical protein
MAWKRSSVRLRAPPPLQIMKTLLALLAITQLTHAQERLVFEDLFTRKDESAWTWQMLGTAAYQLTQNGLRLELAPATPDTAHSDSTVIGRKTYGYSRFETRIETHALTFGSRGWGFWNMQMEPAKSEIAWFIYLQGDADYPLNGFYAFTQGNGSAPTLTKLDTHLLNQAHTYEVNWTTNHVSYLIDGVEVASHLSHTPSGQMEIHIWVDNAIYDPQTFHPRFMTTGPNTTLDVNFVKVFSQLN